MQYLALIFLAVCLMSGCHSPASKSNPKPKIAPVQGFNGKVVRLNEKLRYVVLDFTGGAVPGDQQRLNVYRAGQKVGELKVTGAPINQNITADIIAGQAVVGDDVRPD